MGSSESKYFKEAGNEITTVSERKGDIDPILERLRSLKIASPILNTFPSESNLIEILEKGVSPSLSTDTVDPNVLLKLFSTYRDLQEKKAHEINKKQEEIENKIEMADSLANKLLQRFNNSATTMKTTSEHLAEVEELQVEMGELKGRLSETFSNYHSLCKKLGFSPQQAAQQTD